MYFSKQKEFDADSKAIQKINFTRLQNQAGNKKSFFVVEVAKET